MTEFTLTDKDTPTFRVSLNKIIAQEIAKSKRFSMLYLAGSIALGLGVGGLLIQLAPLAVFLLM